MSINTPNNQLPIRQYFLNPVNTCHKQYASLRAFFCDNTPVNHIAEKFGYTLSAFYSLVRDFRGLFKQSSFTDPFFQDSKRGRKEKDTTGTLTDMIVSLRKTYLSVPEIKSLLDAKGHKISQGYIFSTIRKEGFARLPRRDKQTRRETQGFISDKITAPESEEIALYPEVFSSQNAGVLCLLPYIQEYGLDQIIEESMYPKTSVINKLSSILSFLALKVSHIRRYSADNLWCMDRGMGLFARLNVLPKTAWFSSYSHRITRSMNLDFLKRLHHLWKEKGLLSDTMNLDFTTIPYWGDADHLENNWSGKRHAALAGMLAVLAQDPDSGIIDYGNVNIRHKNKSKVVLEFVDFYRGDNPHDQSLKYLVFDNKFTTYQNLRRLEDRQIKFVTIRSRGKNIVDKINQLPPESWKKIHVISAKAQGRSLKIWESFVIIKDYGKPLRQISITGHGKIKPALLITNDMHAPTQDLVRKYSRRWLVEKEISEQIEFFHFNRVSSSMVIKVDFDFTMTVLAHNFYRLFAADLTGYSHQMDLSIFEKFLSNAGEVEITAKSIIVRLKKKRHLPALLTALEKFQSRNIPWLGNRQLIFAGASSS
jgi:hypothetical protein